MPFEQDIFDIRSEKEFNELALKIFRYQLKTNGVYHKYVSHLDRQLDSIKRVEDIPFLPIEMFREHMVITGNMTPSVTFQSSGTSGQKTSKHFIVSEKLYRESFTRNFMMNYAPPEDLCILALLPSYLERENSSLVYMMNHLIGMSMHPDSGFYLDDLSALSEVLGRRIGDQHPSILLGVSFALLDLAEKHPMKLTSNIILMETGGMKGRRKELVREELHAILRKELGVDRIHSEYGMTEILSQAYSKGDNAFRPPPWMRVFIRDIYDPFTFLSPGHSGAINIIDLANIYSCSFIATGDLGLLHENGNFEVRGRFDQAELRGCNLMVN